MRTRLKVRCNLKHKWDDYVTLYFHPVYSGSEENEKFFKYTPGGQIIFNATNISNADKFEVGKEYYVDIFSTTSEAQ